MRKDLQGSLMRRRDRHRAPFCQLLEKCRSDRSPLRGVSPRSNLVDQDKARLVGLFLDPFQVCQMGAECAEIVLDRLLVADVHKT